MKRLMIVIVGLALVSLACSLVTGKPVTEEMVTEVVEVPSEAPVTPTSPPTDTPRPTPTREPTYTPTPILEAEVEVLQVNDYFDAIGQLVVIGLIQNTGEVEVESPTVIVTLFDQAGTEIEQQDGFCMLGLVPPGEVTPFRLTFLEEVPEGFTYEVQAEARVASEYRLEHSYRMLEVVSAEGKATRGGGYEILGEVRNAGQYGAEYTVITVSLFDKAGALLGVGRSSPQLVNLPPGESSPFQFFFGKTDLVQGEIERSEFMAEADRGEQVAGGETPPAESPLEMVDANAYVDSLGNLHVIGLVYNGSDQDLERVQVFITLRDSQGKVVATSSASTSTRIVLAGEIAPFEVLFTGEAPEDVADVEGAIQGRLVSPFNMATWELKVHSPRGEETDYGSYKVTGEVENLEDVPVESVTVLVALFDAEDHIIGLGVGYPPESPVDPGERVSFEVNILSRSEGEIDRAEVLAEAIRIE